MRAPKSLCRRLTRGGGGDWGLGGGGDTCVRSFTFLPLQSAQHPLFRHRESREGEAEEDLIPLNKMVSLQVNEYVMTSNEIGQ